jgi:hypothetical protein
MSTSVHRRPAYLKPTNALFRLLSRCGVRLGVINILTVTGRSSGQPRSTPVSPVTVAGRRFVLAPLPQTSWARNARVDPVATLARGRKRAAITLVEVQDATLVREVMTAFPTQVPHGVRLFIALGLVTSGSPAEFAAAAPAVTAFEIRPA